MDAVKDGTYSEFKLTKEEKNGFIGSKEMYNNESVSTLNQTDREYKQQYNTLLSELKANPKNWNGKNWLAPNGNVSNLKERQYMQVRTPQFKNWFGDWEKSVIKKEILSRDVVEFSIPKEGEELDMYNVYRNEPENWRRTAINWVFKKLPESDSSLVGDVSYRRSSIRDALTHGKGALKFLVIRDVNQLVKNGVLFHTWEDGKGNAFYNFAHSIKYDGKNYIARLVVRKDRNGNRFYDHEFSDIIKKDTLPNGTSSVETTDNLTHLSSKNILQDILDVNTDSISKVSIANSVKATQQNFNNLEVCKTQNRKIIL